MSEPDGFLEALTAALPQCGAAEEEGFVCVPAGQLLSVCRWVKNDPRYACDYVANLTAVDYPPDTIEIVYHLFSMLKRTGPVALKVKLDRSDPRVPSVTPLWRSAEYQEREVFDLFGVEFEDHPDLRRILMWEGFEGYPMRKDYRPEDQDVLEGALPVDDAESAEG